MLSQNADNSLHFIAKQLVRMKKLLLAFILVTGFMLQKSQAQIRIGLSVNINSQPDWGPSGYDYAQFYYFPDIDVYYDVVNREFVYFDDGQWIYSYELPSFCADFDLYNAYKVVVNETRPYLRADFFRREYAHYRGYHGQPVLRARRDYNNNYGQYQRGNFDQRRNNHEFEQRRDNNRQIQQPERRDVQPSQWQRRDENRQFQQQQGKRDDQPNQWQRHDDNRQQNTQSQDNGRQWNGGNSNNQNNQSGRQWNSGNNYGGNAGNANQNSGGRQWNNNGQEQQRSSQRREQAGQNGQGDNHGTRDFNSPRRRF